MLLAQDRGSGEPSLAPDPVLKPFVTLATAITPDGAELSLHEHDRQFYLRVNRQPLMGTNASASEKTLADLGCEPLRGRAGTSVLIGGLGFGFTLKRVLELVVTGASVHVAELLPQVVAWNREFLRAVNGTLLDDPRVTIFIDDVFDVLRRAAPGSYDSILLDVDNGPIAMVHDANARLYQRQGFAIIHRALRPGARATFWSARNDRSFAARLAQAGFKVTVVAAKPHPRARRSTHTIFVAQRPAG